MCRKVARRRLGRVGYTVANSGFQLSLVLLTRSAMLLLCCVAGSAESGRSQSRRMLHPASGLFQFWVSLAAFLYF